MVEGGEGDGEGVREPYELRYHGIKSLNSLRFRNWIHWITAISIFFSFYIMKRVETNTENL